MPALQTVGRFATGLALAALAPAACGGEELALPRGSDALQRIPERVPGAAELFAEAAPSGVTGTSEGYRLVSSAPPSSIDPTGRWTTTARSLTVVLDLRHLTLDVHIEGQAAVPRV